MLLLTPPTKRAIIIEYGNNVKADLISRPRLDRELGSCRSVEQPAPPVRLGRLTGGNVPLTTPTDDARSADVNSRNCAQQVSWKSSPSPGVSDPRRRSDANQAACPSRSFVAPYGLFLSNFVACFHWGRRHRRGECRKKGNRPRRRVTQQLNRHGRVRFCVIQ